MASKAKFILIKHEAKKRGTHYDLRFEKPGEKDWISFATTKKDNEMPPDKGKKISLIRTNDHSPKEATFTGTIKSGYGAGKLTEVDSGTCEIEKFNENKHIIVNFHGKELDGRYHILSTTLFGGNKSSENIYMFFRAKK